MTQSMTDPYAELGIPRDASEQTALEAYRRLAKRFHPDVAVDPTAGERMRRINEAWRILSSPTRRARYDSDAAWRRSFDDGSGPFRQSSGAEWSQRMEPPQREVERDPGSLWPVIAVAIATLLVFGMAVGLMPPLLVVLLVLGVSRIFRAIA